MIERMDKWEDDHPVLSGLVKLICIAAGIGLALFGAFVINTAWPIAW